MENRVHNEHDKAYKDIFSNKEYFAKLLQSFVKEEWVNDIDENSLEYVNESFILPDFIEKEADVIYKLKFKDKNVILYCLLELQSTPDFSMPIRLLFYMTSIWNEIIKNEQEKDIIDNKSYKLPAIVPMILYNGGEQWNVKRNFKEILDGYEIFSDHIIDFKYILFDVNRYSEDELIKIANIVSTIFYLDQNLETNVLRQRIIKIVDILKILDVKEIGLFKRWIRWILRPRVPKASKDEIDLVLDDNSNMEVDNMISNLAITLDKLRQEGKEEGIEIGMEKGIEKGFEKGIEATAILALKEGAEISFVAKVTKLPIERILELKRKIENNDE